MIKKAILPALYIGALFVPFITNIMMVLLSVTLLVTSVYALAMVCIPDLCVREIEVDKRDSWMAGLLRLSQVHVLGGLVFTGLGSFYIGVCAAFVALAYYTAYISMKAFLDKQKS